MTEAQWAWLTSMTGITDRQDAEDRLARLGTVRGVALEVLRERRAGMLSSASSVTIPGAISVSFSDTLKGLDRLIAEIEAGPDDPTAPDEPDSDRPGGLVRIVTESRWARR